MNQDEKLSGDIHRTRPICKETFRNLKKKHNIGDTYGQSKTDYRIEAEHDVKHAVATLVGHTACLQYCNNPNLIINYDATQFQIGKSNKRKDDKVLFVKKDPGDSVRRDKFHKPRSTRKSTKDNNDLNFGIKWFCIMTAAGYICNRNVFLIADNQMNEGEFEFHEVPSLKYSTDENAMGYVCFCRTRNGNKKNLIGLIILY